MAGGRLRALWGPLPLWPRLAVVGIIPIGPPAIHARPIPVPHSSRGPGHRPLKAEITGSNPVCGTSSKSPTSGGPLPTTILHVVIFTDPHDNEPMCGTNPGA